MEFRQILPPEDQETSIHLSYIDHQLILFSSRATVLNRLIRKGYTPSRVFHLDGEPESAEFIIPMERLGELLRVSVFKHG